MHDVRHASPPTWRALAPWLVWGLAIAGLWLLRVRGSLAACRRLGAAAERLGVPAWLRALDVDLWLILLAVVLWLVVRRVGRGIERSLWLRAPFDDVGLAPAGFVRGIGLGVGFGLPMGVVALGQALYAGLPTPPWHAIVAQVLAGPAAEEIFFRGVLVFASWRCGLAGFWPLAVVSGAIFGAAHVGWSVESLADGWPTVLVTGAGGVWFAWLGRAWGASDGARWRPNLWLPMALHAAMNGAWLLVPGVEGPAGSLGANLARAATIAASVLVTVRCGRARAPA